MFAVIIDLVLWILIYCISPSELMALDVLTTSGKTLVARSWTAFPTMHREDRMNTTPNIKHALQGH